MNSNNSEGWNISPRVPRRTPFWLFVDRSYQIFAACLIGLAGFLSLGGPKLAAFVFLLAIIPSFIILWKLYHLDPSIKTQEHPHHELWSFIEEQFYWPARVFRRINIHILVFFAITVVSIGVLLADKTEQKVNPLWVLTYIPVLALVSWKIKQNTSEWFGIFSFAGAILYLSAATLSIQNLDSISNILSLLQPRIIATSLVEKLPDILWLLIISSFIHFILRKLALSHGQAKVIQEVTRQLRERVDYTKAFEEPINSGVVDKDLNQIANYIGQTLGYDRVHIVLLSSSKHWLYLKGAYGAVEDKWPNLGWALDTSSITGWVAINRKAHLCINTDKCDLYYALDGFACNSEATVPILVEGDCIGVIDINSRYHNAFDSGDVDVLWQVANAIGTALAHHRHVRTEVEHAYSSLAIAAKELISASSLDSALKSIVEQAKVAFDADLVILYQHAVGTEVPLPNLVWQGVALEPKRLGQRIHPDHRVMALLQGSDSSYFQPEAEIDPQLLGPNNGEYLSEEEKEHKQQYRFVKREKIKSVALVSLGVKGDVVGSLFLNYRKRTVFSLARQNDIKAFANVLALAITLKRQVDMLSGPLAGMAPLAHSQAQAAFESLLRKLKSIDPAILPQSGRNVMESLSDLQRQWMGMLIVEHTNVQKRSLAELLSGLESRIKSMYSDVSLQWQLQKELELQPTSVREMLYKIIAESVSNAIVHGKAQNIRVNGIWKKDYIKLSVNNDGVSIDPLIVANAPMMRSAYEFTESESKVSGILALLIEAERWFGASWSLTPDEKEGTQLICQIPLLAKEKSYDTTQQE